MRGLLGAALHHLREQEDAVQVDELLGEGDIPGEAGQVLQCLQLRVHAGRLDAFVQLLGVLSLRETQREECSQRKPHENVSVSFMGNKGTVALGARLGSPHAQRGFDHTAPTRRPGHSFLHGNQSSAFW